MELPEQGIVELSWKNVGIRILPTAYQPTDYTLYWCENDKDSHECSVCKIAYCLKYTVFN